MKRLYLEEQSQSFLIKEGNEKVLLIMTGNDGTLGGYNDKYLKIAEKEHAIYGATVIISDNPRRSKDFPTSYNFDTMMDFVEHHMKERYTAFEIYFMGVSAGGSYALMYAYRYKHICRILAVNAPFMINTHKLLEGINRFTGEHISLVYGDGDPSYQMMPFIRQLEGPKCKVSSYVGADHNFAGMEEAFIMLSEHHLFAEQI